MKRLAVLLMTLLMVVPGHSKSKYVAWYFTYDAVDVHESPDDASPVTMKLVCDRRPSSYDEKTAEIPYAFSLDNNQPAPIGIRKIDKTGQWGYFSIKFPFVANWYGWVKLSELIPIGTMDKNETRPTYEIVPAEVIPYKRPSGGEDDKIFTYGDSPSFKSFFRKFTKGDKVQEISRKGGWVFVQQVRYADSAGNEGITYGWVPLKSLKEVESFSRGEIAAEVSEAEQAKALEKSKGRGKLFQWGVKHWNVVGPNYRKVCKWGSIAALVFAVLFLIPAIRRKRWMGAIIVLPAIAVFLYVVGAMSAGPGIMYGLAAPLLATSVLYPLLYFRPLSRFVGSLIRFVGIAGSLYVMAIVEIFNSSPLLLHAILLLAYAAATIWLSRFIAKKLEDDVCPNCGFYAGHDKLGEEYLGTSSKTEHSTRDVFDHSSTSGNVTTNYYIRERSSITTHSDYYSVGRRCARCGYSFDNEKIRTRKEYH